MNNQTPSLLTDRLFLERFHSLIEVPPESELVKTKSSGETTGVGGEDGPAALENKCCEQFQITKLRLTLK